MDAGLEGHETRSVANYKTCLYTQVRAAISTSTEVLK